MELMRCVRDVDVGSLGGVLFLGIVMSVNICRLLVVLGKYFVIEFVGVGLLIEWLLWCLGILFVWRS